ncbi:trigger factor [Solirubrobacter phytolaccae]|uniref:Trigger factor n=1 Tax=Solirubrobacter phytolaccae TaxID=1404360 RepID=A0A9X3N820_9ACTN|nr:trigger factor [Solirubrobacter phytolaccae]MDA0181214.1 trigger factor [Solirubrobacter phytolaccae]
MATDISTTLTELPESRVRVDAEVGPAEVERRLTQAAKRLAGTIRVPGFRPGKAPPAVVIKRIGREAIVDEAVRESLGAWYRDAIDDAHVVPVGEPEVDLGELPKEGEPLKFTIEIGVRPKAELGEYKGLEVEKREPGVPDEQIDQELEGLRERAAKLDTVDRAAGRGDFVVMDFAGSVDGVPFPGGEGRDQMIELGSGRLVPGFEDQLEGAVGGEDRDVTITFPEDYPATELASQEALFKVTVREVKAKQLPALDDDLAVEAGFDTLDELREDIRSRLAENEGQRAEAEFREAALDAAVNGATVEVPDALVEARAREMWESMLHSLSHQGINRETYLQISGTTEEETIEKAKPDADVALRREAVLAAIAETEKLEPSEEEMLEAVTEAAGPERVKPEKLLERLRKNGRLDSLKDDLSQRKAWDVVVDSAKPVPAKSSSDS